MRVSLIAALDEERGIGKGNRIPWHIPADLKRFKALTTGHAIIMGRKTYESIGQPLPDRTNIVITRDDSFRAPGCTAVHSLEEALAAAEGDDEAFIVGGAQIYEQALNRADRLYLTLVEGTHEADTFFPEYEGFREVEREKRNESEHAFSYVTLERA
jgi:dihydrofolate reductase